MRCAANAPAGMIPARHWRHRASYVCFTSISKRWVRDEVRYRCGAVRASRTPNFGFGPTVCVKRPRKQTLGKRRSPRIG